MMNLRIFSVIVLAAFTPVIPTTAAAPVDGPFSTVSKNAVKRPAITTPEESLQELQDGNARFLGNASVNTDYKRMIQSTAADQHPHAMILSCIDSRVPPEIIFDQGIGNLFVARVAGNVEDPNMLGSMEFAVKVKGIHLIVVMGHNKCGAVKGAIDGVELGNLTQLTGQIKPAITGDKSDPDRMATATSKKNVELTIHDILEKSPVIAAAVRDGKVQIKGAFYDVETGKVTFLD